ncbi:MAG: DarT ssDNA thymidine ADP-ribosyltransferase family protein [Streptococcus xiaochunlingii]
MNIRGKKLLYHLTHINNLDSIIENGLLSRNQAIQRGLLNKDIANHDILESRQLNHLEDYVLFHFSPYTAFDNAVRYEHGAENFVYITVYRRYAEENGFQIVPRHPLNGEFELCDYNEGMNIIDWETMERRMNEIAPTNQGYAKEVKMAECISSEPILLQNFAYIYCNERYTEDLRGRYPIIADKIQSGVWLNGD